jgi:hypothetical protein
LCDFGGSLRSGGTFSISSTEPRRGTESGICSLYQ